MPLAAGGLDPQTILQPEQAAAVRTLAETATPAHLMEGARLPKPCDMVPESQEAEFRKVVLENGMTKAVPDSSVQRFPCGRPVLYGRFGVKQKVDKDRRILDLRQGYTIEVGCVNNKSRR